MGTQLFTDESILTFSPNAAARQVVYLDFDGADTRYNNRDLNLDIAVSVENSGLTEERQKAILEQLNRQYAEDDIFLLPIYPIPTLLIFLLFILEILMPLRIMGIFTALLKRLM